ncbi:hypothetical protein WN944_022886 [Citrus x changshan-huyou]|uniref:Uncharacterized protein n=1 Tax=Citrus x changshan-huyou TaxID=2935761 RepID=A0AAP0R0S1_9ROSI
MRLSWGDSPRGEDEEMSDGDVFFSINSGNMARAVEGHLMLR